MTAAADGELTALQLRRRLPGLLAGVVMARAVEDELGRARGGGAVSTALADARLATLHALLRYAAAIEALSWPVPRGIVMEIRMHRIVCAPLVWSG